MSRTVLALGLTATTLIPAVAEADYLLWLRFKSSHSHSVKWERQTRHPTAEECERTARARTDEALQRMRDLGLLGTPYKRGPTSITLISPASEGGGSATTDAECWPDTVDPRK